MSKSGRLPQPFRPVAPLMLTAILLSGCAEVIEVVARPEFAQAVGHFENAFDSISSRTTGSAPATPALQSTAAGPIPDVSTVSTAKCTERDVDEEANRLISAYQSGTGPASDSFKRSWIMMGKLRELHISQHQNCPDLFDLDQVLAFDDARIAELKDVGVASGWLTPAGQLTF
ncbi:MAG: hypothetical protein AAGK98_15070 [Pseudomonadota bacterium]